MRFESKECDRIPNKQWRLCGVWLLFYTGYRPKCSDIVPKMVRTRTKPLVSSAICPFQDQLTPIGFGWFVREAVKGLASDLSTECFLGFVREELDLRVNLFMPERAVCIAER